MRPLVLLSICLLALAGCQTAGRVINPEIADLEQIKTLHAAGSYAEIAQTPVGCSPSAAGCAQLRFLKADSCSRLASSEAAARREHLDCAIENYEASLTALDQRSDPAVDRRRVEVGLLDATTRRRDSATGSADAAAQNRQLQRRATQVQAGPNARPVGDYYAAEAMLNDVLRGPATGGCEEIAKSLQLLDQAGAGGTDFARAAANLRVAANTARTQRGCTA